MGIYILSKLYKKNNIGLNAFPIILGKKSYRTKNTFEWINFSLPNPYKKGTPRTKARLQPLPISDFQFSKLQAAEKWNLFP